MSRQSARHAVHQLLELAAEHPYREHVGPGPHRMSKRLESESIGFMRLALKVAINADDLALRAAVREAMASISRKGNGHMMSVRREVA